MGELTTSGHDTDVSTAGTHSKERGSRLCASRRCGSSPSMQGMVANSLNGTTFPRLDRYRKKCLEFLETGPLTYPLTVCRFSASRAIAALRIGLHPTAVCPNKWTCGTHPGFCATYRCVNTCKMGECTTSGVSTTGTRSKEQRSRLCVCFRDGNRALVCKQWL